MEGSSVAAIAADDAACAIRVAQAEVAVLHQGLNQGQDVAVAVGAARLQAEPFVDDQCFVFEHRMKAGQSLTCQRMAAGDQCRQRVEAVCHVASTVEALQRFLWPTNITSADITSLLARNAQIGQCHACQCAAA